MKKDKECVACQFFFYECGKKDNMADYTKVIGNCINFKPNTSVTSIYVSNRDENTKDDKVLG